MRDLWLEARVVDAGGAPRADVQARLCGDGCQLSSPGADGWLRFDALRAADYTLQIVDLSDAGVTTPNGLVRIDVGRRLADPIRIGPFGALDRFEAAGVHTGAGLELDVDPSALTPGGYAPSREPVVASLRLSPAESGLPLDLLPVSPLALWELGTFDVLLTPPASYRLSGLGLPEGARLRAYVVDNADHRWIDAGTLTVGADGVARLSSGGLPALTTLVVGVEAR